MIHGTPSCTVLMQNDLLSTLDEIQATSSSVSCSRPSSTPSASASCAKPPSGAMGRLYPPPHPHRSSSCQSSSSTSGCTSEQRHSTQETEGLQQQLHSAAVVTGPQPHNVVGLITPAILRVVNFAKQIPGFCRVSRV